MKDNIEEKKTKLVEVRLEVYEALKKKQLEYSNKVGKLIPLVDITTKAVTKGIDLIE